MVASPRAFYVWQFKNYKELAVLERGVKKKGGLEKLVGWGWKWGGGGSGVGVEVGWGRVVVG